MHLSEDKAVSWREFEFKWGTKCSEDIKQTSLLFEN
jgi:hypothetical protein